LNGRFLVSGGKTIGFYTTALIS